MKNDMYIIIESKVFDWKRIIKIDDEVVYNYFKPRLANFSFRIERNRNLLKYCDCSIIKQHDFFSLADRLGNTYSKLSLSSCFTLLCMKYINIKKEGYQLPVWALHAGGFIYNNDLCVIVGSTHSGKSTTMFDLISNNYDIKYINDDITLFDTKTMEVLPFCKPLQLRKIVAETKIKEYYVDSYKDNNICLSTISPSNLNFENRLKYNKIKMFLLVRDNNKELEINTIGTVQKYLSLMFNCYNNCIQENRKHIMALDNVISGYQIVFQDGVDVSRIIMSLL